MNAVILLGTALVLSWPTPAVEPASAPRPAACAAGDPWNEMVVVRWVGTIVPEEDETTIDGWIAGDYPATLPFAYASPSLLSELLLGGEPTQTRDDGKVEINLVIPPTPAAASATASSPSATAADRWILMRELQGTAYGTFLNDNRMYLTGWIDASFTASTAAKNNQPVVWNDRANEFLLQQAWVRLGRSVVTSGTTEPTFGFQIDVLMGSDYRFTLPRGLFNGQLQSSDGQQNLYGVDPIQQYVSAYVPTLFRGTEFRAGRLWTPWGVESLEAVSNPLISRSYAFNSCPPFTHCGAGAYMTLDPEWSAVAMAANGNDVYFGDPSAEWRFVGNLKWTQPGGANTVTVATSFGRGKFDATEPFAATTLSLSNEAAGRNNFNCFDIVWTHAINPRLAYNVETIFGYQTNVPGLFNATGGGTATWFSVAQYLFSTLTPRVSANVRLETFWDFQGQRTGFEGLYTATTAMLQFKPRKDLILRSEVRYDYNGESRPFEGKHGIFTAGFDVIYRW